MSVNDLSKLRVLVADDEPELRDLVALCVRQLGCQVLEAADGDDAWQLAQAHRFDLAVLDVMMPGMSGWEVCRRIKGGAQTNRGGRPKVLMLTGIGEHLNEMTSPLFSADDWIDKPFELEDLKVRVARLGEKALAELTGPSVRKARPSSSGQAGVETITVAELVDHLSDEPSATEVTSAPEAAPSTSRSGIKCVALATLRARK